MVLYVNADRKPATRNDGRAAAANQLRGALIALDPKDEMGLQSLLTDVWRLPTETAAASAFLGQSPQSPAEEAPAAAIVPPPVSAEVAELLAPLVKLARGQRDEPDTRYVAYEWCDAISEIVEFSYGQLRALLRAAGLFTDDMRPSQPPETPAADASVKPAEVAATPPPADADEPEHYRAPYAHNATSREDPI